MLGASRSMWFHALLTRAAVLVLVFTTLSACGANPVTPVPVSENVITDGSTPMSPESPEVALRIYAPASPSSIPVIIAAEEIPGAEVTIFTDHSQANTLFLRDDVDLLVTGLSVGVSFFSQDVPVQMVNSYVAGLTYLVTHGEEVYSFSDLRGKELVVPFEGSPIEEVTRFFVAQEGLVWGENIEPMYLPFPSAMELLKQGEIDAVALPEPFVTMVEGYEGVYPSLSYRATWDALTSGDTGYPQVGTFAKSEWADAHTELLAAFNAGLSDAIAAVEQDRETAVAFAETYFAFPPSVLSSALSRTSFALRTGSEMSVDIQDYYTTIGNPLDETFDAFFYLP